MESILLSLFPRDSEGCLILLVSVQRDLHSLLCSQILSDRADALDEQLDSELKKDLDDSLLVKQLNVDDSEFDMDEDGESLSSALTVSAGKVFMVYEVGLFDKDVRSFV